MEASIGGSKLPTLPTQVKPHTCPCFGDFRKKSLYSWSWPALCSTDLIGCFILTTSMPQKPGRDRPSDCSRPTTLHEELTPDLGAGHPTPEPAGVLAGMVTDLADSQKVLDIDPIAAELGVIELRREAVAREHGVCYQAKPSLANQSFSLLPFDP